MAGAITLSLDDAKEKRKAQKADRMLAFIRILVTDFITIGWKMHWPTRTLITPIS